MKPVIKIVLFSVLALALIGVLVWALVFDFTVPMFGVYNEKGYSVMDASGRISLKEDISAIEIDWSSKEVSVSAYEGSELVIRETAKDREGERLRYQVKNGVLSIHEFPSGIVSVSGRKSLEVLVPAGDLSRIEIDVASASVNLTGLTARSFELDAASGDLTVQDCSFDRVEIDQASGSTVLIGSFLTVEHDSSSGNFTLVSDVTPREISANTASGDVELTIPKDSQFTLEFDTASGDWKVGEFTGSLSGERFTCGNGSNKYEVDTASGDLTVHAGT